jgi:hypothetical protein
MSYIPEYEEPLAVIQAKEAARRQAERDAAERQRLHERDRKVEEQEQKRREAEDKKRHDEVVERRRTEAKAELDAQMEKLHREYLDAGGSEKNWPAFREQKALDLIAGKIGDRERKARESFLSYARGQ